MTRLRVLAVLLLVGVGYAQRAPPALTLDEAQNMFVSTSDAVALAAERENQALADLRLVGDDPYSLRADLLRAGQAVDLAELRLTDSRAVALVSITDAYLSVLVARARVEVNELELRIASIRAAAARARFAAGAITRLDLDSAERTESLAAAAALVAADDLAMVADVLWGQLPAEVHGSELLAPTDLLSVPDLEALLETATAAITVVSARNAVALAEAGLAALHPSIHARIVITAAETALDDANRSLVTAAEQERERLEAAHRSAARAGDTLSNSRGALDLARARLNVERARFDNGLAAEVELLEAELGVAEAELAVVVTERAYVLATLPLWAESNELVGDD